MPSAKQIRALIVDDQAVIRKLVRNYLHDIGVVEIKEAFDGRQALRMMADHAPNLVISDFIMPNLDGFGLLRTIRTNPATQKTAFVMLSGRADKALVERAAQYGANNFLVKPFTLVALRQKLEAVLGRIT